MIGLAIVLAVVGVVFAYLAWCSFRAPHRAAKQALALVEQASVQFEELEKDIAVREAERATEQYSRDVRWELMWSKVGKARDRWKKPSSQNAKKFDGDDIPF